MDKLLLIDGHSILNRAFYGLPDLTNSKGQHTNAVLGFINMILKVIEEENPTHMAVAFDLHAPTFRHEMYKEYKGTRKGMPEELRSQVPMMKELLGLMGVTILELEGFEADDIIGTMSVKGEKNKMEVAVLSGDRDLLQLATEHVRIRLPKTKGGKTTVEQYYADDVKALYGVTPKEFIDMKGLMGDASDNIPGVPGIGEKTAGKIIADYHSIEEAYAHIDEIKPKKAMDNLREFYDQAIMSKVLATIKLDVPVDVDFGDLKYESLFTDKAYDYIKELELKSLLKYFDEADKKASVDFKVSFIDELDKLEEFFNSLRSEKEISVHAFFEGPDMMGMGFSAHEGEAVFIPCAMFITDDLIAKRMKELYRDNPNITFITNDLKKLLKAVSFEKNDRIIDTSVAAYLLNPLKDSYSYDDIARDYIGLTIPAKKELLGKSPLNIMTLQEDKYASYIAYETCVPFIAANRLVEELKEKGMYELYMNIELPIVYVLRHMEYMGIRVDKASLLEYGKMLGEKEKELSDRIYDEAGREFNINSPKQLGEILFDELKLPGAKKTKTGYSTNVDVLNKLKNDYPIVADVLDYRQVSKLKSTYADGLSVFISDDGRIHGTFNQTITATGRISSTDPNLQNIPMRTELGRSIRKVFIPRDGYVFVDADYSQIELRVLAHMSGDENLIAAFKAEEDIHAMTASQVFGVPLSEVDPLMRRNAKAVNFGIVYGISAFGLSEDLGISRKEAADYIDSYFATYPEVKRFIDESVENAKKTGMTRTMFGRIRQIPELSSSNFMQRSFGERVAMNSPIQGTAADIIKIAMIRVYDRLKKEGLNSQLILQIHDELLIEAREDEVERVKQILVEEMMQAADLKVPLSVSASVGDTWFEAK
ncbi:MAG: DNA polymerase I [Lachnospiraceae bacterium]|nr:DNA polymerase I [Lachnospiraceae bacterium]